MTSLVSKFFKILPMKESGEDTLTTYMESLQAELSGCSNLIQAIHEDADFLTLMSLLQFLLDTPDCSVGIVRREVFHSISICKRLQKKYGGRQEVAS
jgi:hypothetical protein